jgi:hypothetical protein
MESPTGKETKLHVGVIMKAPTGFSCEVWEPARVLFAKDGALAKAAA